MEEREIGFVYLAPGVRTEDRVVSVGPCHEHPCGTLGVLSLEGPGQVAGHGILVPGDDEQHGLRRIQPDAREDHLEDTPEPLESHQGPAGLGFTLVRIGQEVGRPHLHPGLLRSRPQRKAWDLEGTDHQELDQSLQVHQGPCRRILNGGFADYCQRLKSATRRKACRSRWSRLRRAARRAWSSHFTMTEEKKASSGSASSARLFRVTIKSC